MKGDRDDKRIRLQFSGSFSGLDRIILSSASFMRPTLS